MSQRFERTLEGMEGALREYVLPQLKDSFARGQLYGVIYMLRYLGNHADWAVTPLSRQLGRIQDLHAELQAMGGASDMPEYPVELKQAGGEDVTSGAQWAELRDTGMLWLDTLLRWQFSHSVNTVEMRTIGAAIYRCVSDLNSDQALLTPRPMFSQISTGQEP